MSMSSKTYFVFRKIGRFFSVPLCI